jgi:hypothetical protein
MIRAKISRRPVSRARAEVVAKDLGIRARLYFTGWALDSALGAKLLALPYRRGQGPENRVLNPGVDELLRR